MNETFKKILTIIVIFLVIIGIAYLRLSDLNKRKDFKDFVIERAQEYEKKHEKLKTRVTKQEAIEIAHKQATSWAKGKYTIINIRLEVYYENGYIEDNKGSLAWNADIKLKNRKGETGSIRYVISALTGEILLTGYGMAAGF